MVQVIHVIDDCFFVSLSWFTIAGMGKRSLRYQRRILE